MTTIYLLDKYAGDGSEPNPYRPACIDALFGVWHVVTDQPTQADGTEIIPNPNVVIVQISDGADLIAAIENHPDYGPGAILYDEPNPYPANGKPDANEYGKRRSYCARMGISQTQFREMFGTQANPNTRQVGADNCQAWIKTLKKGSK